MFGIILIGISTVFSEASDSIGKHAVSKKHISFYTFAFLNLFFGFIILVAYGLFRESLIFSLASLPTFLPRLFLEILQAHFGTLAIVTADRSLYGFLRVSTIPLLLLVDFLIGYPILGNQVFGIILIVCSILILFSAKAVHLKGFWLVLFVSVNAVATISLYKYDISNFNSVAAEQGIVTLVLSLYFFIMATWKAKENPLVFLKKPVFLFQSISSGLSSAISSFAYLFAPASIITTAVRAFSVLSSVIAGNLFFKEKRFLLKLFLFILIVSGLIFLVI